MAIQQTNNPDRLIAPQELAERWGICVDTLKRWRAQGRDPSWVRIGRQIRYRMRDVEDYEQGRDQREASSS